VAAAPARPARRRAAADRAAGPLVATQTFASGRSLEIDARLAGLVVAIVLVWRRANFLVVVFATAATAALLRAVA
jgi:hypothetical protein